MQENILFSKFAKIGFVTVAVMITPFLLYKVFDENLRPESRAVFGEDVDLEQHINETKMRLAPFAGDNLKTLPQETVCSHHESPLPLNEWQKIKSQKSELVKRAMDIATGPA